MKPYLSVLKLSIINGIQYRAAALAGMAAQLFWGFIFIMIYEAFYGSTSAAQPISFSQLVTYIWLQQAFLIFVMLWFRDSQIFSLITSGNIAYELCRPCGLYGFWYSKLLAQRLSGAMLRCFPILIVAFLLPMPFRLGAPHDVQSFLLFIAALFLGLLILVSISMFIYIATFITMSPSGSTLMISIAGEFFAGLVIPIPLMPDWLRKIAYALPFRLTSDLPFRIYSGNISHQEAVLSILFQFLWLGALLLLGRTAMNRVLRKVAVQGG